MTKSTVVQFGAKPGARAPAFSAADDVQRVHGEIKKMTTQPGKIEIVFVSECVDADIVTYLAELQQRGTVYLRFEHAPEEAGESS
jgi:hypothetical protein